MNNHIKQGFGMMLVLIGLACVVLSIGGCCYWAAKADAIEAESYRSSK